MDNSVNLTCVQKVVGELEKYARRDQDFPEVPTYPERSPEEMLQSFNMLDEMSTEMRRLLDDYPWIFDGKDADLANYLVPVTVVDPRRIHYFLHSSTKYSRDRNPKDQFNRLDEVSLKLLRVISKKTKISMHSDQVFI